MDDNLVIFTVTSLVLGGGGGFFLGRFTSGAILYLLWIALVGSIAVLVIPPLGGLLGLAQDEWSQMAYVYLSVIFLAPALVSSGLFGWLGQRQRRKILTERETDV